MKACFLSFLLFLSFHDLFAQRTISGEVTSADSVLPGVTVQVKGTKVTTQTDIRGQYRISAPAGGVLVFTHVGFATQEVKTGEHSVLNIRLASGSQELNGVVVIGYGSLRKKDLTGSVASVTDEMVKDRPIASLNEGLVGQVPGVDVSLSDATPGGEIDVKIRGIGSIGAGVEPLYVIDGFPTTQAFANALDPSTILSLDVLKDASSTAIYGSRGSNGVVMITTKSGKNREPSITFNTLTGQAVVAKRDYYQTLNGPDYVEYTKESLNNQWVNSGPGRSAADPNSVRVAAGQPGLIIPANIATWNGISTDWQSLIFRPATVQSYDMTVTGGTSNVRYLFSGGFYDNQGVVEGTGYQKYTAQAKIDGNLFNDRIEAGIDILPAYMHQRTAQYQNNSVYSSAIGDALGMPSDIPLFNPDGSYGQVINPQPGFSAIVNPVQLGRQLQDYTYNLSNLVNTYLQVNITKDLNIKTTAGATLYYSQNDYYYPSTIPSNGSLPSNVGGFASTASTINWLSETTINYHKTFATDHTVNVVAGYSAQKETDHANSVSGNNFPNDLVQTLNAAGFTSGSSSESQWSLLSYYARLNYSYQGKYLVTGTVRRDGSSVFGRSNQYGNFPSGAVGWVASNENFMKGLRAISFLKLRASYGISGNNAIGDYSAIGLLSNVATTFGAGAGSVQTGIIPTTLSNPDLKWEKSAEFDAGLDVNFIQDRISVTADYYNRHSSNLLLTVTLPTTTGFSSTLENVGEVENLGYEIGITTKNFVSRDFHWTTTFNIAYNFNKVLSLGPTNAPISGFAGTHITKVGGTVGANYGLKMLGVLTAADIAGGKVPLFPGEHPGDPRYYDFNGDGTISNFNGNDAVDLGKVQPSDIWGLINTFSYRQFDLNIMINGQWGGHIMDLTDQGLGAAGANALYNKQFKGRYISDAQPGNGHTLAPGTALQGEPDNRLVQSTNYTRIRTVSLGYTVPSHNRFYKKLRVFATVENLITWKLSEEYNPQGIAFGSGTNVSINGLEGGASYPIPRTVSLGVNFGL
ncbi:MAG TPA: TonB-dependent receptor [Puia sp.]|jgi:TonB-linked SusC/RagA family outer membrane protein|nr:TonB-dependent receptor [Puia sp.]